MSTALTKLQLRYDTAGQWAASNPVLLAGEPGVETDTGRVKFGNGTSNWAALPYSDSAGLSNTVPEPLGTASAGSSTLAARADHVHGVPSTLAVSSLSTTGNVVIGGNLQVVGSFSTASQSVSASSVIGLSEAVDDRVAALLTAGSGVSITYSDAADTLTVSLSVDSHTHEIANITGLVAALAGKANATHTHVIGDIPTLADALDIRPTSDPSADTGSSAITNIVTISQTAYDALGVKSPTTLYIIS